MRQFTMPPSTSPLSYVTARSHAGKRRNAPNGKQSSRNTKKPGTIRFRAGGVDDAARTRDLLNHNQGLYQLSYVHHVLPMTSAAEEISATDEKNTRQSENAHPRRVAPDEAPSKTRNPSSAAPMRSHHIDACATAATKRGDAHHHPSRPHRHPPRQCARTASTHARRHAHNRGHARQRAPDRHERASSRQRTATRKRMRALSVPRMRLSVPWASLSVPSREGTGLYCLGAWLTHVSGHG